MNDVSQNQNVEHIVIGDKEYFLVGTAHVSKDSVELAENTIREVRPDSVAIELCKSRYESLKDPERWKKTDIIAVIREGRAFVLLTQLLLAGFQKKLGKQLQVKPGEEMMRAASVAEEVGAEQVLADRDVKITLKRTWAQIGFGTIIKLLASSLRSLFDPKQFSEEEIEKLKNPDVLDELMREFSKTLPQVKTPLIDERDQYLSQKVRNAPGHRIVAIVGAGHVPGMKKLIHESIDIAPLDQMPQKSPAKKMLRWSVLAIFILVLLYAFIHTGMSTGVQMIKSWFWVTAIFSGIGAALCLAHPLTILSAFLCAPFTTFPPLLAAGWVAGLVEAVLRKPRVSDFERIVDDISSFRGAWTNRVSRIILIMAFTNITSALGAAWGAKIIITLL